MKTLPAGLDVSRESLNKRTVKERYLHRLHHFHVAHSKCPVTRLTQMHLKDLISMRHLHGITTGNKPI